MVFLMNSKIYTIYYLYDNRFEHDVLKHRCYIGFTSTTVETRIKRHFTEAKNSKKFNKRLNWLRTVCVENINFLILENNLSTIEEACSKEVYYISLAKQFGLSEYLRNGDDGGLGSTKNYTEETIEKIRQSKLGNNWNVGKKHSEENIEKRRQKMLGKKHKPEHIAKLAEARLKNKIAGKIAFKFKNRKFSEEGVVDIFEMWNSDHTCKQIAEKYNCSKNTITNVLVSKKAYLDIKAKYCLVKKSKPHLGLKNPSCKEKYEEILRKGVEGRRKRALLEFNRIQKNIGIRYEKMWDKLYEIYSLKMNGLSNKQIGVNFNLHFKSIERLLAGKSWANKILESVIKHFDKRNLKNQQRQCA